MSNPYFRFKQFTIYHDRCSLKVTTDACLFGAWCATEIQQLKPSVETLLDIGMGTGLLPLMIAQKNPSVQMEAVEIDQNTWQQGSENILGTAWKDQITAIRADVRKYPFDKQYDCIISNPPFYESELPSADGRKNTALHSAALSLEELLHIIRNNLAPAGIFFLLLPFKRQQEAERLLQKHHLLIHKKINVRQSVTHNYFRILIKGGLQPAHSIPQEELSIWNEQQQYTAAFTDLLKDYYLYL